ncbi:MULTISPECIES: hypothetical protein [Pseudoxanthomonas]|uniref:DUF2268 domain-containing protein n=1 Tax=Pseudoxanthomonas winnipegensis TaxID=2480810 RepID=A0AAW8G7I3_9GAMM|nr:MULTISPECIES: hypothetical protein [Pseudoxanthomonas]MDQ1117927.1 hypothetical protein [Pseudoxanthomonas winnipegensis]MDQ1134896.1 hypothetical protein [Pseudoxanthomonas winnipegensis]MDR6138871.1 hypothetical protein [Pseudoxanthomonas sp. SORGH_AS_0997]
MVAEFVGEIAEGAIGLKAKAKAKPRMAATSNATRPDAHRRNLGILVRGTPPSRWLQIHAAHGATNVYVRNLRRETMATAKKAIAIGLTMLMYGACRFAIAAAPTAPTAQATASTLDVHNISGDFLTFWDATQGKPMAERVAIFKRDIAAKFPDFYGFARFGDKATQAFRDGTIEKSIEAFGPIRDAYAAKVKMIDEDLPRNTQVFLKTFPDFHPDSLVWILHSLGEMDGGTRVIDGKSVLIFGVDGMVTFHSDKVHDESAFFHHELFHVYHEPRLGPCEETWCSLWREGLAVYASSKLDPDASEDELLLTLPDNMAAATREKLLPSLLALKGVLMSKDHAAYADLFNFGGPKTSDLPQRRGYYLGFLVAQDLGKTYDLHTLANMPAVRAQPLVSKAVDDLIAKAKVLD